MEPVNRKLLNSSMNGLLYGIPVNGIRKHNGLLMEHGGISTRVRSVGARMVLSRLNELEAAIEAEVVSNGCRTFKGELA